MHSGNAGEMATVATATSGQERQRKEAEEAQTGGRPSPEAGGALTMLGEARGSSKVTGELGEALQTRGGSNRRSARRRGVLKPPECCWGPCDSRGTAGSTFHSLARRDRVGARWRRRDDGGDDPAEEERKPYSNGWKS